MRLVKYIIPFLIAIFSSGLLLSQDTHFSQFEASPLHLNSAMGGFYNGDWRAGLIYRNQWQSIADPFTSFGAFFDRKFRYYSKEINGGILMIHDESGAGDLISEKVYLNASFPFKQGRSRFTFGLQPGLVIRYFDGSDLTFPNQFNVNTGYFDNQNLDNQENQLYNNRQSIYFDLNAGLMWSMNLPKISPSFGFSVAHLNSPNDEFVSRTQSLSPRINIHGDLLARLKNKIYIRPSIGYFDQNTASMLLIGSELGIGFKSTSKVSKIFCGIYYRDGVSRNPDAIIPLFGFTYDNWRFGISYDQNISHLTDATDGRGAYEFSIIFTSPSSDLKHSSIPCERY